jgi:hypothetical protein
MGPRPFCDPKRPCSSKDNFTCSMCISWKKEHKQIPLGPGAWAEPKIAIIAEATQNSEKKCDMPCSFVEMCRQCKAGYAQTFGFGVTRNAWTVPESRNRNGTRPMVDVNPPSDSSSVPMQDIH